MDEKRTDELDNELKDVDQDKLREYLKKNENYMKRGEKAFYYYFKDVLECKDIRLKDVYSFAGLSESYGTKLVTMEKHTKNRDEILRLCIAGRFTVDETSRALKLYGFNALYSKDPRDVCIIVALNSRKFNFADIDDILENNGFAKLSKDIG